MRTTTWTTLLFAVRGALALPQAATSSAVESFSLPSSTATSPSATTAASASATSSGLSVSAVSVSTVVASPTAAADATLPSQQPLPPKQAWCPSEIFCAGDILQTVNVAQLYADPKTFVDKPTIAESSQAVLQAFASLNSTNATEGSITNFVNSNFAGEGQELEALVLGDEFNPSPAFLDNVTDPLVRSWVSIVNGYWTSLIRTTNQSLICDGTSCSSTFIPLNHSFVIPGGRFREQYYWDSFWIVEGLLQSELFSVVNGTLQNFMDEIELYGFIPNGGRTYYLDRSQPPLFTWMLSNYITASNDTSILARALPLAERELSFWNTNRSLPVTSPTTNKTHTVYRYTVSNTAPRPESYLTDYTTAFDPSLPSLNETERGELYAELATGAETGWDYSTRFIKEPLVGGVNGTNRALRALNVRAHVPVDLNSILYKVHALLAELYETSGSTRNATRASELRDLASSTREAILDLNWNATKLAFYDFNTTSNAQNSVFSAATFYPLWAGIVPDELLANSSAAFGFFASVNLVLGRYNGTFPATFYESGLQWDAPNAWPPHQYIALQALRALPSNVSSGALPTPPSDSSTYALIPSNQLGLPEDALPPQPITPSSNASLTGPSADINVINSNGTVTNGGNATDGEGWRDVLVRGLANRYITSALCSWYSTGGEIPGYLERLPDAALNISGSVGNTGNMFEKFSINDIDIGGSGGEYTVQAGFGWTNGVVLWAASQFGSELVAPNCPNPLQEASSPAATSGASASASASASGTGSAAGSSSTQSGGAVPMAKASAVLIGSVVGALVFGMFMI